tara:strand:- start:322 stop:615 length:294 start_codon:yes stop_codon:yes gene_type:complete
MILKFGKYKGQRFENTPESYQNWLLNQKWFKIPKKQPLYKQLNGWNGYSNKGQAIYDQIFEQEKNHYINQGLECSCGLRKFKEDKYCKGDHCQNQGL